MVKLVLGDVNVGNVLGSTVEEVREDHSIDGTVPDDHDIFRVAAEIKRLLDSPVDASLHGNISFSIRIDIVIFVLLPRRIHRSGPTISFNCYPFSRWLEWSTAAAFSLVVNKDVCRLHLNRMDTEYVTTFSNRSGDGFCLEILTTTSPDKSTLNQFADCFLA